MTEISAAMVKQLRDATSAGMMDCKRALQETEGDFDAAVKLLREKGMASAAKRADRETNEGIVLTRIDGDTGAIVAVGCETEPVSKNDDFLAFAQRVLDTVFENGEDAAARPRDRARRARRPPRREHPGRRRPPPHGRPRRGSLRVRPPAGEQGRRAGRRQGRPRGRPPARDAHLVLASDVLLARRGSRRARRGRAGDPAEPGGHPVAAGGGAGEDRRRAGSTSGSSASRCSASRPGSTTTS